MDIQQLKYFRSVAQHGKISAAAEELFLSATALSTSISRLEKEVGFSLFDRTNNRIILNQQGEIFLRHVNHILSILDSAEAELYQSVQTQKNHIYIYHVDTAIWTDLIVAFTQEHPDITLSCAAIPRTRLSNAEFTLPQGFLLATEEVVPASYTSEYDSIHLFDNTPMVLMPKGHPLASNTAIDVAMLQNENILLPMPDGYLYQRIQHLFQLNNLHCPLDKSYSLLARYRMVSNNSGISFTTKYNRFAGNFNLHTVPLNDPFGPFRARMYWHKDRTFSKSEQIFMDFTKDYFSL